MKVIFICGSHMRHHYVLEELFRAGMLAGAIIEERGNVIPSPPNGLQEIDKENFIKHFKRRDETEKRYFGSVDVSLVLRQTPHLKTDVAHLNSQKTIDFIKNINADYIFSYGCHLLSESVLSIYEGKCFNIHGGLSPWFKGVATHFWPFYFLKPNWTGMTIHRTVKKIDAGEILHHSVPLLEKGDGIHDVACKTVLTTGKELIEVLSLIDDKKEISCVPQIGTGKLFLDKEWTPQHLRLIYNTFNDDIVDCFLNGEIVSPEPQLVDFIRG